MGYMKNAYMERLEDQQNESEQEPINKFGTCPVCGGAVTLKEVYFGGRVEIIDWCDTCKTEVEVKDA